MNKCLVTKLNGSSGNSELLRLGEMRIRVNKIDSPNRLTQSFAFIFRNETNLEIIGDGYFTDENLTANNGKKITIQANKVKYVYVSNGDFEIAILDKYSISLMSDYETANTANLKYSATNKSLSGINVIKYSSMLTSLNLSYSNVTGDIANLKNLTSLTSLVLSNNQVTGDIANLKNLTSLTSLVLSNDQVTGDIANLKSTKSLSKFSAYNTLVSGDVVNLNTLTNLTAVELNNTQVSGDISTLKTLTNLNYINIYNKSVPLTGDIGALSTLTKCTEMTMDYSKLTGDLATLPASMRFISFSNDKGSVFTWSTRPSSAKIIAISGNASVTNVDKMLQDQAQCQVGFSSRDTNIYKIISVAGSRTSTSDDAVEALQQKGYTISIAKS